MLFTNVLGILRTPVLVGPARSHRISTKNSISTAASPVENAVRPAAGQSMESVGDVDAGLVEEVKSGDIGAFRELVEKYQARALNIAFGLTHSRPDSEDLVQEAFLKAFKNIGSFKGQAAFYTWFYRILVNLSVDRARKKSRKYEISEGDQTAMDSAFQRSNSVGASLALTGVIYDPDRALDISEIRIRISKAFSGLTEQHRTIVVLREIDGLSYDEISEVLGCSKGTVMSRLHYARKKLQEALADLVEQSPSRDESVSAEMDTEKS